MALRSLRFHVARLIIGASLALLIGWWAGYPAIAAIVAVAALAAWNLGNALKLHRSLQDDGSNTARTGIRSWGVWADVFGALEDRESGHQREKDEYLEMLSEFQNLNDAFPDATLVIDEGDNITWCNDAAVELLQLHVPQDIGQPVTNLVRGSDFANWLAVQEEVASRLEMPLPRDETVWLSISAVSLRDGRRLIILRDSSEVHNLERIRRDFVANISHELRTPLTVLLGYLELLNQDSSPELGDTVTRMQTQANQMQAMLNDLLELSRLQNDDGNGSDSGVDMAAMLMQLKEQAEELSAGRHIFTFEVNDGPMLKGNPSDLESAARNLIVNAVNYTPEGGTIDVRWHTTAEGPELLVADSGIGIPRRSIPRLTERFYRVGSDRARSTGGTGLGLAIVKHVLNAHQARLEIESELGEGSTFRCIFPADRAMQTLPQAEAQ